MPTIVHAPATEAATRRVNDVGQRLLAANAELPVRPVFLGIGSPDPQIFHRDTTAIYVSDGLVSKCTTEAQLAAVVASELGKMVSTREALLALKSRRGERDRPAGLPIGTESGGTFGPADGTRLAELGKFEKDTGHGPTGGPPSPPPDPDLLARTYLEEGRLRHHRPRRRRPAAARGRRSTATSRSSSTPAPSAPSWGSEPQAQGLQPRGLDARGAES